MPAQPSTAPQNLTDVFVRGFKNLTSRRLEVRDTYVTGLVLRVTPKGAKSFSPQTRFTNGEKVQLTLGSYPGISVKDARQIAKGHFASIARGEDPRDLARIAKELAEAASVTLRSLLEEAEVQFAPPATT